MQRTIEELKQKADQGFATIAGRGAGTRAGGVCCGRSFRLTVIEPVPKGEFGGDIVQNVREKFHRPGRAAPFCGRRKAHSELERCLAGEVARRPEKCQGGNLRPGEQCPAQGGGHVSHLLDGVWIAHPRCVVPVAMILAQHACCEVTLARQVSEGQQSKTEMVYQYLTGAEISAACRSHRGGFHLDAGGLGSRSARSS